MLTILSAVYMTMLTVVALGAMASLHPGANPQVKITSSERFRAAHCQARAWPSWLDYRDRFAAALRGSDVLLWHPAGGPQRTALRSSFMRPATFYVACLIAGIVLGYAGSALAIPQGQVCLVDQSENNVTVMECGGRLVVVSGTFPEGSVVVDGEIAVPPLPEGTVIMQREILETQARLLKGPWGEGPDDEFLAQRMTR